MPESASSSHDVKPIGVAKVVKLGKETLLVATVTAETAVPEGEYVITVITANPSGTPSGAGCGIQVN
jgi:hypothetical protein